jgi:hypothetical protein
MKILKTFETWNNNIIDNSLFSSGRAKYNPKVVGNTIRYKTGTAEPYYFAEINQKGNRFICKVYKKKKDGEEIRIRNKIKKDLRTAHNYVREFLNQKMRLKKKKKEEEFEPKSIQQEVPAEPTQAPTEYYTPPKSRTIIRKYY